MQPATDGGAPPTIHDQSQQQQQQQQPQVLCPLNMDPYTQLQDAGCPSITLGLDHNNQNTINSVTNL